MNSIACAVLNIWAASAVFAGAPLLHQLGASEVKLRLSRPLELEKDQIFQIVSGTLTGKRIAFASVTLGEDAGEGLPQFIVSDSQAVLDARTLPTLQEGWNLVSVDAVSAVMPSNPAHALRILALVTLVPLSGRTQDMWQQAFALDIDGNGKICIDAALNGKLAARPNGFKTMGRLKAYLKTHGESGMR